jgi:flavin-dependent dehydrogenase
MESYDVVVVGAGTAGLSAGRVLQDRDVKYIILDSKKEIGKPIRSTGGVSYTFVNKLGMPKTEDVVAAKIRSLALRDDIDNEANLSFDHDVGVVYDFTAYEKKLAAGLNVKMGTTVQNITGDRIKTTDGDYVAKNVIVASGPQSSLVPNEEYKLKPRDTIIAYEETRKLPPRTDYDLILWFSSYAPGGYVWDFPDSGNKRRIGIGIVKTSNLNPKDMLRRFTNEHTFEIDGEVDHTISHQIPVARPVKRVVIKNVCYAGDIAHTCFPDTGGGLQSAFWSGSMAARACADGNPEKYQEMYSAELYKLLSRHYKVKKILYSLSNKDKGKVLNMIRDFTLTSEDPMKEIPRLISYVIRKNPIIAWKILKSYVV